MLELLAKLLLQLVIKVAPPLARRFYGQDRLTRDLRIRVRSEGDGVVFNCGEMPYVRAWLTITNLSPLDLEIERLFGRIYCGSELTPFYELHRHTIKASTEKEIFLDMPLNRDQAAFLSRNREYNYETNLTATAYIISSLHSFELADRRIAAGNVRFQNCLSP